MTRIDAREMAVRLCFGISDAEDPKEKLETFFDKEYYASLKEEDELYSSYPSAKQRYYISAVVEGCYEHKAELDDIITANAKGWKINRISSVAVSILRTALYEIIYMDDIPASVSINEAVELAKKYEEAQTVSFVNGVLGGYMRSNSEKEEEAPAKEVSDTASED